MKRQGENDGRTRANRFEWLSVIVFYVLFVLCVCVCVCIDLFELVWQIVWQIPINCVDVAIKVINLSIFSLIYLSICSLSWQAYIHLGGQYAHKTYYFVFVEYKIKQKTCTKNIFKNVI